MFAATICYRSEFSFNLDYYLAHHVPMSEELMKPLGMVKSDVRKIAPNPDGTMPLYQVITTVYFESAAGFQAFAASPLMAKLGEDIPNFTQAPPDLYAGEVVHSAVYTK